MQLRNYQSAAVDSTFSFLRNESGNGVIVLPTGAGKTPVTMEICKRAIALGGRIVILTHVKELVEQIESTLQRGGLDCGVYSAGLKRRDLDHDIVIGGIQSIYTRASELGKRNLVIVDEAHRIGRDSESMYGQFLAELREINPRHRVIGLTATPYRLDCGPIVRKKGLFTKTIYEANVAELIRDGWLCKITNQPSTTKVDTSNVKKAGGEFVLTDLENVFCEKTLEACTEIVNCCDNRKSVLVFCSGVKHAYDTATILETLSGDSVGVVVGETSPLERASLLMKFKRFEVKYLVNVDVLTTGFDAPNVDALAVLRATMSPGLFAQIAGRGFRLHESKQDCLLLDFGGNLQRHGPLDAIDYGRVKEGGSGEGTGPLKECPGCEEEVPAGKRVCDCGFEFPKPEAKYEGEYDNVSNVLSQPERFEVVSEIWVKHDKKETPSLRVIYEVSQDGGDITHQISEWVCFEHEGFARMKALNWWKSRSDHPAPDTIDQAIEWQAKCGPARSLVARKAKYWEILSIECDEAVEGVLSDEEIPF